MSQTASRKVGTSRAVFRRTGNPHWREDMDSLKELIYACPNDLRIANYFSRKHVTTVGVLDIIDIDDNYVECMQTESFQAYDEKRKEVDKFNSQIAAARDAGPTTWKAGLVALAALWLVLLLTSETVTKIKAGQLAILFTLASASLALGSGAMAGSMLKLKKFDVVGASIAVLLFAPAVCSIAFPIAFGLFPWKPVGAYIDVVGAFGAGFVLSKETAKGVRDLARAAQQAGVSIQVFRFSAALGDGWLRFGGGRGVVVLAGVACGMIVGCDRVAAAGGSA
jgi:hypothetical protein